MKQKEIENVYERYSQDIYRYAFFLTKNKENAEDIVSEVFIRFMNHSDNVESEKNWMMRVARNEIYNKFKKERYVEISEDEVNEDIKDEDETFDEKLINEEVKAEIIKQLDKLDDRTKEVIVFRIWEELKFSQIADILGEKETTVKLRFYRGIEEIKNNMNKKEKRKYIITLPLITKVIVEFMNDIKLESNLLINIKNMEKETKVEEKVDSPKPRFSKKAKIAMAVFATILIISIIGVGALLLLRSRGGLNIIGGDDQNPSITVTPTEKEPTRSELYKGKYAIAYLENGEIFLSNKDATDKIQITNSGGIITNFKLANNRKFVVYSVYEEGAKPEQQKLHDEFKKAYPQNNENIFLNKFNTSVWKLDLDTNEIEQIIKYETILDRAVAIDLVSAYFYLSYTGNSIITLSPDDSTLIYSHLGLKSLNLADGVVTEITKPAANNVRLFCTFIGGEWSYDFLSIDSGCYESMQTILYRYTNGNYSEVKLDKLGNVGAFNSKNNELINVLEDGTAWFFETKYELEGNPSMRSYLVNLSTQATIKEYIYKYNTAPRDIKDINDGSYLYYKYETNNIYKSITNANSQLVLDTTPFLTKNYKLAGFTANEGDVVFVGLRETKNANKPSTFSQELYYYDAATAKAVVLTGYTPKSTNDLLVPVYQVY